MRLMQAQGAPGAGQKSPSETEEAGQSFGIGPPAGAPPGPPPEMGGAKFASQTLAALFDVQSEAPTATEVANQLIGELDGDGDGALGFEEIEAALGAAGGSASKRSEAFAGLDEDGDGLLSADELASALERKMANREAGRLQPPPAADLAERVLGAIDADEDGSITLAEVVSAVEEAGETADQTALGEAFAKLDTSSDGAIGLDELTSALEAFKTAQAAAWSSDANRAAQSTLLTA